jgi:DNA (cytosine-5)-methyltransferase 1
LFSGIGGFSLGLERTGGFRTVAFCEIDDYCRRVLAKHWPGVPTLEDVRSVDDETIGNLGRIDLVCGGPPCQDASLAGARRGDEGDRWMWPEFLRVVRLARSRWVLAENPPGILSVNAGRAFGDILRSLAESGYTVEWQVLSAAQFGAPHIRERVFILAYPDGAKRVEWWQPPAAFSATAGDVADADGEHGQAGLGHLPNGPKPLLPRSDRDCARYWLGTPPEASGVADGIPARVDRTRVMGNSVTPAIVEWIGYQILAAEKTLLMLKPGG